MIYGKDVCRDNDLMYEVANLNFACDHDRRTGGRAHKRS